MRCALGITGLHHFLRLWFLWPTKLEKCVADIICSKINLMLWTLNILKALWKVENTSFQIFLIFLFFPFFQVNLVWSQQAKIFCYGNSLIQIYVFGEGKLFYWKCFFDKETNSCSFFCAQRQIQWNTWWWYFLFSNCCWCSACYHRLFRFGNAQCWLDEEHSRPE